MKKLPKEKRDRIIQIAAGTGAVLALMWFFLISAQKSQLKEVGDQTEAVQDKIRKAEVRIKGANVREPELEPMLERLGAFEREMAPANKREWIISIVSEFSRRYKVEYQRFASENPVDWEPLPKFPYKPVSLGVTFRANYHDFGKFIAAFENQHPFISVLNIRIDPESSTGEGERKTEAEREKLQFTVEFVALSRPSTSI